MSERLAKIAASKLLAKEYQSYTGTELGKLPATEQARLRQGMVDCGLLTQESGYRAPGLRISHRVEAPRAPLSDRELELMLAYPKATCERFYKPTPQAEDHLDFILSKKTEQEREDIRAASILHDVIQGTVRLPAQESKPLIPVDDLRVNAGELGKLAGLPPDARVTPRQYNDLLAADSRRLAARTPAEVGADRVLELRREAARIEKSLAPVKP